MTEAIYLEVKEMAETAHKAKRRVSVSGMLKHLGVSRSGYHAWLKRVPSNTEKRREAVKAKIQDIYDESKQNYGAPKITRELRKSGEIISERTVGKYMKQMGIKAQWVKPWTITTKDSDFSSELKNILDEQFNPERPNAVWCSDITYIWTIDGSVSYTHLGIHHLHWLKCSILYNIMEDFQLHALQYVPSWSTDPRSEDTRLNSSHLKLSRMPSSA